MVIPKIGNGVQLGGIRQFTVKEGDDVRKLYFEVQRGVGEMAIDSVVGIYRSAKEKITGEHTTTPDEQLGIERGLWLDTVKPRPRQMIEMDDGRMGVVDENYIVRALSAQEKQAHSEEIQRQIKDFRSATIEQAKWNNLIGLVTTVTGSASAAGMDKYVMPKIYIRSLNKEIAKQPFVYRYMTESGYQASLKYNSVAGYTTTKFSNNPVEIMQGAQIPTQWPGAEPTGAVRYRVTIPVDKLKGFTLPRPNGDTGNFWWERRTWSYPEYGKGGWTQFKIKPVPLSDVKIEKLP